MTLQKGVCQNPECGKEYEYEYNPKYPRKYCHECSAKKKAEFAGIPKEELVPVVKPGAVLDTAKPTAKNTTMYVSYAKDIFCALINTTPKDAIISRENAEIQMKYAIELVKQAREEFS